MSRYAPEDVASDEAKQERFLEGLNDEISVLLVAQDHSDFQQLVSKAIQQEGKLQEIESQKRKKAAQRFNPGGFPKPRTSQPQTSQRKTSQTSSSRVSRTAQRLSKSSFHKTTPRRQLQKKSPTTSSAGVTCFICNEVGHYANKCPKKQQAFALTRISQGAPTPGSASSVKPGVQYSKGRVTHITAEKAQATPDVVLGTFLVNSVPALVLFDSGVGSRGRLR